MKRIIPFVLSFLLLIGCFSGCGVVQDDDKLDIVCTIFPVYDWMRELTAGSENINLILLADNGVDMHSYQPTTGDIVDMSTCDMFVYVGGESEEWVKEVLDRSGNEDMMVIELLSLMGDRALENSIDGHHDHDHGEHDHHCVLDEHIWLSPVNAIQLCGRLTEKLCALDGDNAGLYTANGAAYGQKLTALDGQYRQAVEDARVKKLVFADRFPFRYMTVHYGLEYHAAFDGCSAETEASFETVVSLSEEVDESSVGCVLIIEGSEDSLARTVIEGTERGDQVILAVDSMQSVTAEDIAGGASYIGIMESNLQVFRQVLGC